MRNLIKTFLKNSKIKQYPSGLYLVGEGDLLKLLESYKAQLNTSLDSELIEAGYSKGYRDGWKDKAYTEA
jgi:hypothetical protein